MERLCDHCYQRHSVFYLSHENTLYLVYQCQKLRPYRLAQGYVILPFKAHKELDNSVVQTTAKLVEEKVGKKQMLVVPKKNVEADGQSRLF